MSRAPNRRLKKAAADKSINVLVLLEWTLRIFSCFSMVLCGCRIGLVRWWMVVWYVGVVVKRKKERETIHIYYGMVPYGTIPYHISARLLLPNFSGLRSVL